MGGFAAYWLIIFVTDGMMGLACREWGPLAEKNKAFFGTRVLKVEKEVVFFSRLGSSEFSEEAFTLWGI